MFPHNMWRLHFSFLPSTTCKFVGVQSKHLWTLFGRLWQLSATFINLWKCSENARKCLSGLGNNVGKSLEIFGNLRKMVRNLWKIVKNGIISMFIMIIKRKLYISSKIRILCSHGKNYISRQSTAHSWDSSCHSNIKFISLRHRVISSILSS